MTILPVLREGTHCHEWRLAGSVTVANTLSGGHWYGRADVAPQTDSPGSDCLGRCNPNIVSKTATADVAKFRGFFWSPLVIGKIILLISCKLISFCIIHISHQLQLLLYRVPLIENPNNPMTFYETTGRKKYILKRRKSDSKDLWSVTLCVYSYSNI